MVGDGLKGYWNSEFVMHLQRSEHWPVDLYALMDTVRVFSIWSPDFPLFRDYTECKNLCLRRNDRFYVTLPPPGFDILKLIEEDRPKPIELHTSDENVIDGPNGSCLLQFKYYPLLYMGTKYVRTSGADASWASIEFTGSDCPEWLNIALNPPLSRVEPNGPGRSLMARLDRMLPAMVKL